MGTDMRTKPLVPRRILLGQGAAFLALLSGRSRAAEPAPSTPRWAAAEARLIDAMPYERIEVPGAEALARWQSLRTTRPDVWPVIVGGDEDLSRMAEQMLEADDRSVETILSVAARLEHPQSLLDLRAKETAEWRDYLKVHPDVGGEDQAQAPEVGDWPRSPPADTGLTVAEDILARRPFPLVHILLLPTTRPWEVPAYLKWGGWNECPPAEIHVAAMRRWATDYGAEIVGISGDVINVQVKRRPSTRDQAIALAQEQYAYCADIVDQGTGEIAPLAAALMASDWWFFWWD